MIFRTHLVFSIAIYFLLLEFLEVPNVFVFLIFIMLATVFVDIDSYKSCVGNRWYLRPLQWLTRHRGIVHSLFFGLVLSLVIAGLDQWAGFGFFVGYVSHLFLDALTKSGVNLFWPLDFKIKGFIKSGGMIEDIIFVLLLFLDVFLFWRFVV